MLHLLLETFSGGAVSIFMPYAVCRMDRRAGIIDEDIDEDFVLVKLL